MYKNGFVPPQPSGTQQKKHMQICCEQCYQSGSDPIRITENCLTEVSKTRHESFAAKNGEASTKIKRSGHEYRLALR